MAAEPAARDRGRNRPHAIVRPARGPDAARFFYDEANIRRDIPGPLQDTLFGRGSVHTLNGEEHRCRKEMFLSVEKVSKAVGRTLPDLVSWNWYRDERSGLARLDYTQNAINKTLVAPFSIRSRPHGPVSVPIR